MNEPVTEFKPGWYDSRRLAAEQGGGRIAVITIDNGHDHTRPSTLGAGALDSLEAALDQVAAEPEACGLLLTGKPFVFAAGADLQAFAGMTPQRARAASRRGHELFGRLRDLEMPTLAAVNGACLGGGVELALHCDYRTLSAAVTAVAFPEVFLSIVPAWGGTQLVPAIAGAANALTVIVHHALDNNRMMRAAQAHRLGLADRLLAPVDFFEQSLALLEGLITGDVRVERPAPSSDGLDEALGAARRAADDRVHGATPAPYAAIDLIEFAARGGSLAEGLGREEDALAELLPARHAQASVYSFDLTQRRVKRQPGRPQAPPREIRKVAVVGAGLMGAQLGALLLERLAVPLVVRDIDADVLERARAHIDDGLAKRVANGRLSEGKAAFLASLVTCTLDDEPLAGADLVLEAVPEVAELKRKIFGDVEHVVDAGAVLASNTSSLSVTAMGAELHHPERVVGLHFFNPPAYMPLVEVVRTPASSDEAVATAFDVAARLRKSAVACADTPAFVVNRLLTRFMGACTQAVNAGGDFAEVDDAVKALGLPMGPFELLGLVGPRVAAHVAATLHDAYPQRFPLDANFQMLGESGLPGVYDWSQGRVPYPQIAEAWQPDPEASPPDADGVRQAALEAVADETRHMLAEGVVADARDVDTCMLLGAGWPFFNGGICLFLDQTGISQRLFGRPLISGEDAAVPPASGEDPGWAHA